MFRSSARIFQISAEMYPLIVDVMLLNISKDCISVWINTSNEILHYKE